MKKIVKDIIVFYKSVGALDELSERNLYKPKDLNTIEHKKYLEELIKRYDIDYNGVGGGIDDEIINMESLIDEKFTEIMESKL